jgi:hypothetical protein
MVAFFVVMVIVGVVLYLIPMDAKIKQFLIIAVIIVGLLWLLQILGVLGSLSNVGPR